MINFLYSRFEEELNRLDISMSNLLKNNRILDIGCGVGELVAELQENNPNVYGMDYNKGKIMERTRKIASKNLIVADAFNIPFKDNSFDMVISTYIFAGIISDIPFKDDFIPSKKPEFFIGEVMKEIYRVLNKEGLYLLCDQISIPNRELNNFKKIYPN